MTGIPAERWRYRERALAVVEGRPCTTFALQESVARAVPIPVPPGVRVQDSVLVEFPPARPDELYLPPPPRTYPVEDERDLALAAVADRVRESSRVSNSDVERIVGTAQAVPVPVMALSPPLTNFDVSAIPLPPGYEAVRAAAVPQVETPVVDEPPDAMPLGEDLALDDLPIGKHAFEFLCGTAGVGKTWLARKLRELMGHSCVLCATTGIAAVNLGEGSTIHSLLGFKSNEDLREKYITGRIQLMLRKHRKAGLRRIVLDEISMLHADSLTYLTRAIDDVNNGRKGGLESVGQAESDDDSPQGELPPQIGLTLVGDFAQLPPVPDEDYNNRDKAGRAKKLPVKFAFESPEWGRYAAHTVKLTTVRRQDAQDFVRALHAVRRGDAVAALRFFTPDKFCERTEETFKGTTIFATNAAVDRYNEDRLDHLPGEWIESTTARWGYQPGDWKKIPDTVRLKVGATVMILANRREQDSGRLLYSNGDLGEIVAKESEEGWKVRLFRNHKHVYVARVERSHEVPLEPERRAAIKAYEARIAQLRTDLDEKERTERTTVNDVEAMQLQKEIRAIKRELAEPRTLGFISEGGKHEVIGTIEYMPLRCGYGSTVHKCQGLTLDEVQVNIRDDFFRRNAGMLFVALSRARTAEGLRIIGTQGLFAERCRVEPKVLPWL